MSEERKKQVQALPKVELHLHLEGCATLATLRTLCRQNRKPLPVHLQDELAQTHVFGTFDEFVFSYQSICQAITQEQDFALLIADVADYLKRNTILYAEVAWTPFLYLNRGLHFEAIMEIMNEALIAHAIEDRVHFVIDIQRDHGIEAGSWVYQQVFATSPKLRIAGVGLTGQEEGFPPSEYQALYSQAREHGLGVTAHAGEYGTPEDIWQCVRALGVKRIGHGIRAVHDRALLDYLAEQRIHLEICPTSNVRCLLLQLRRSFAPVSEPVTPIRTQLRCADPCAPPRGHLAFMCFAQDQPVGHHDGPAHFLPADSTIGVVATRRSICGFHDAYISSLFFLCSCIYMQ